MNSDFRVDVDFFAHHKTRKLKKRLGSEAVICLMQLWAYAARNRPDGTLCGMGEEDVELAADWDGEDGAFAAALLEIGFLEKDTESGELKIHSWAERNSWAAEAGERSDQARFMRLANVNRAAYARLKADGVTGISKADYKELTSGRGGAEDDEDLCGEEDAAQAECSAREQRAVNGTSGKCLTPAPAPALKQKEKYKEPPTPPNGGVPPAEGTAPLPGEEKTAPQGPDEAKAAQAQQRPAGGSGKRPPTPGEVQAYCDERKNGISAEGFCDYYAARGWRLSNGQPLRDWRAAVRNWERRDADAPAYPAGRHAGGRVSGPAVREEKNRQVLRQVAAELDAAGSPF